MIDGHSLNKNYSGSAFSYLLDHLDVDNIKKIEIIRGPGSALYGDNAFVAVINIITKNADDIDGVIATIAGGSFNTRKYNLLFGKAFENKLKISGSLNYWKTGGPDLRIAKDRLYGNPVTNTPGYADTYFEGIDLFLNASYERLTYKGQYIANDRGVYIGFSNALTDGNSLKLENYWHELSYRLPVTGKLSSNINLYYNQFEQDASVKMFPEGYNGTFPDGMIGGPKVKDRTTGGEFQADYEVSGSNHLLAGLVYEEIKQFDVKSVSNFNPNTGEYLGTVQDISSWANWNKNVGRYIYAFYIQDEWKIREDLNLTGGIRYDHYSDFGDTTNPRIGLVWGFTDNAEVKLLYGQAFRAPSFSELYNDNNPSLMGNPDLKPEKIRTYEANIGYRFTGPLRIDLTYFYNDIDDMIIRDSSTTPAAYANIGGAEIRGVEMVLSGNYTSENYWKITYAQQDPRDSSTDERLPYVPVHRASGSINYGLSKNINAHTDILWTGKRYRPDGDTRNDAASYTTVDVALTLKNLYKTLEIQGTVHNLLDERYQDPDVSGASQYIPDDYPREGVSGMISASYKF